MKRFIKASAGDIRLYKFLFIDYPYTDEYSDMWNDSLEGYLYLWEYTYNTLTRETDDRDTAHADVIDNLPFELRKAFRSGHGCWGKTDYFQTRNDIRWYCNDESFFTARQLKYLKNLVEIK